VVACGREIEGSSEGAATAIRWVEAGDERTEELLGRKEANQPKRYGILGSAIYMSYAVSPVLCLPKNATAEFLIRFIQSAVENAETGEPGDIEVVEWGSGFMFFQYARKSAVMGIRYKLCANRTRARFRHLLACEP
jgi:hypothetical protein